MIKRDIIAFPCTVQLRIEAMASEILEHESVRTANCKAHDLEIWLFRDGPWCGHGYSICHFKISCCTRPEDSQDFSNFLLFGMNLSLYRRQLDDGVWQYASFELPSRRIEMNCNDMVNAQSNIPYLYKNIFRVYCRYAMIWFACFGLGQCWVMLKNLLKTFSFLWSGSELVGHVWV